MTISTDSIRYYGRNRRLKSVSGELAGPYEIETFANACFEQGWTELVVKCNGRDVAGIARDKTTGAPTWWAEK
jgi:hypothetical protein